jgi:hypothetical protein
MPITIRRAEVADAAICGTILYAAFQRLAERHGFPRDFPSAEVATGLVSMLLAGDTPRHERSAIRKAPAAAVAAYSHCG